MSRRLYLSTLLLLAILAAHPLVAEARGKLSSSAKSSTSKGAPAYTKIEHVVFLRNHSDDGDSFHVRAHGREHIFRLYFVDTPETDMGFPERVAEQAAYFGITPAQAVQIGKKAEEFTKKHLSAHLFTIETRWLDARGRSRLERFYAHIFVGGENLAELLVANGLARIHGVHANLPDGTHAGVFEAKLRDLEASARAAKLGAWALSRKN